MKKFLLQIGVLAADIAINFLIKDILSGICLGMPLYDYLFYKANTSDNYDYLGWLYIGIIVIMFSMYFHYLMYGLYEKLLFRYTGKGALLNKKAGEKAYMDEIKKDEPYFFARLENDLIEDFENGKYSRGEYMLSSFFYHSERARKLQKKIAGVFLDILTNASANKWNRTEYGCRENYYIMHWKSDYSKAINVYQITSESRLKREDYPFLTDEEYNAVLCIGTFNRNGYFREACLRELPNTEEYLKYYFVRANDWVNVIKKYSRSVLSEIIPKCSITALIRSLPVAEKLLRRGRRTDAAAAAIELIVCGRIGENLNKRLLYAVTREEFAVRKAFYNLMIYRMDMLDKDMLKYLVSKEPFGMYCVDLLEHYGIDDEELEEYIHHKNAAVRYQAILSKLEKDGVWDGIEEFLLDKTERIRGLIVFELKKHTDFDPRKYYSDILSKSLNKAALTAIGNYGTKEDAKLVEKFLDSDDPSVARIALISYGKLMGEGEDEKYWSFLCSKKHSFCGAAYSIISKYNIQYEAARLWEQYNKHSESSDKKYFLYLLANAPTWRRMRYMLYLYINESLEEDLRVYVERAINIRNQYAVLSSEEADILVSFINENKDKFTDKSMIKSLLFDISHSRK